MAGEGICGLIARTRPVLDMVVVPKQASQIHMLLRGLDNLSEQFLEASVVLYNGELMAQKVLAPLLHGSSKCGQCPNIC